MLRHRREFGSVGPIGSASRVPWRPDFSRWFWVALALQLLVAAVAQAQIPGLATGQAKPAVAQVPDPRALKPDWWSYVAKAEDQLEVRGQSLKESIDQAVLTLAVAEAEGVSELAERARRAIDAYVEDVKRAPQVLEATLRTSGTFTLDELLEAQRTLWTTGIDIGEEKDRMTQSRSLLTSSRRRLDQLILAYNDGGEDAAAKLKAGVEIIAERAELALTELRVARRQARVEQLEAYRKQLQSQIAYARKNLEPGDWDPEGAEKTLADLAAALEQSRTELAGWRDKMLTIDESDTAGRVNAAMVRQQLLAALEAEARRRLDLANFKAQKLWHRIHATDGEIPSTELTESLTEFRDLLASVRSEFDDWQRNNEAMLLEPSVVPAASREVELRATDQRARTLALETLRQLRLTRGAAAELSLMVAVLGEDLAASQGGFRGWLERAQLVLIRVWSEGGRLLDTPMFDISDTPITPGALLRVLIILLVTFVLSVFTRKGLERIGQRRGVRDAHSLYAVGRLLHYLLITIGLVLGLSSLGLDLGNLALIAGALSVGIGFGLQTTVSNFVSGLILLFDRSLKVGDYVELDSGFKGTVQEVTVRATRINTNDNVDVLVPNSEFVSTKLTNWTLKEPFARLRIPFGVAYGSNKELVRDVALAAADRVDLTLHHMPGREPHVRLTGFGDSSLDFELLVWVSRAGVKRPGRSRAEYYWELETGLKEAGIEIPFPQRDLHLKSGFSERQRPFRAPRRRE